MRFRAGRTWTPWEMACALLLVLFVGNPLLATYGIGDIQSTPIERLVRNVEQLVAASPKDASLRFTLARIHAMAFALKLADGQTTQTAQGRDAWFGPEHDHVPFRAVTTTNPAALAIAKDHLAKAIALYREGIALDPKNLTAKLGYAWCLDQSGDRASAITAYRHVIAEGWKTEQTLVKPQMLGGTPGRGMLFAGVQGPQISLNPGFRSITVEAAGYLMPLLDPERDKEELTTLQERATYFNALPRAITPIAIPLRDDLGIADIVDRTARVRFDADGSGLQREWSWITPDAGWLVYAPKGSGKITSALQMFGNVTFWLFWDNGYQALRALDDNADGKLAGTELEGMAIWRDANSNGVAEDEEVLPLDSWGIVALSWRHEIAPSNPDYAARSEIGVTLQNGRTRPTWDVLLHAQPAPFLETD